MIRSAAPKRAKEGSRKIAPHESTTSPLRARGRESHFGSEPRTEAHSNIDLSMDGQSGILDRAYEGFLRLPVAMVLVALWLFGMALLSAGTMLLYLVGALLVQAAG